MIGLAIIAGISGFILCCGMLSFLLMFQDVAPSQNTYAWPYLIPVGLAGLLATGAGALVLWLAQ